MNTKQQEIKLPNFYYEMKATVSELHTKVSELTIVKCFKDTMEEIHINATKHEIQLPNFYYEMKAKFYQVKIVRYINAMMEEVRVHSNRQPKLMW
jgi:hypothetical protein